MLIYLNKSLGQLSKEGGDDIIDLRYSESIRKTD
jgi:hypothetical protein